MFAYCRFMNIYIPKKGVTLTIDPGVYAIAWAIGYNGFLHDCGYYYTSKNLAESAKKAKHFIKDLLSNYTNCEKKLYIEKPTIQRSRNINQQDVINLLFIANACAVLPNTIMVKPATWKGTVPKEIHQPRITGLLTHEETMIYTHCRTGDKELDHNIVDAIGIFLWSQKRLKR